MDTNKTSATNKGIPPEIRELGVINHIRWPLATLTNWLMIAGIVKTALLVDNLLFYYLCLFPIAIIQLRLALLSHDAVHGMIMKNKRGNRIISSLTVYWPLFMSLESYKQHHFPHHKYAGTSKDPEIEDVKLKNRPRWDLPMTRKKLTLILIKDILFLNPQEAINLVMTLSPKTTGERLGFIAYWSIIIGIAYLYDSWLPVILWNLALMGPFQAFYRLRGLTEHSGITSTYRFEPTWWQKITFLPHNTWCHWEHHKYPFIPYYNLPKARSIDTSEKLISTGDVFESIANSNMDKIEYL